MKVLAASLLFSTLATSASPTPAPVYQSDLPISEVRRRLADTPPLEFLALMDLPMTGDEARQAADLILENGEWKLGGTSASVKRPIRWTGYPRSFSFHLNAWAPVIPFYVAASQGAEGRYFTEGYQIALDWVGANVPPVRSITMTDAMDATIGQPEEFLWYDMSVGLRVYPLAWTLARIARDPAFSDDEVKLFVDGLYFHMEALGRPFFFKAHNNHGFFQAVGQLMAAKQVPALPRMDEYAGIALERLEKIVEEQYTGDWVHREHSPAYHEHLLRTFLALRVAGLPESPRLLKGISAMEESLSWMFTPDFQHAAFGDTSGDSAAYSEKMVALLQNQELIYQVSGGKEGKLPASGVRVFTDAGYAFARFIPESGDFTQSSYLAQMSAFHSRTHKHSDHATFIWYDRGLPILDDPGRFGYVGRTEPGSELRLQGFWYSDPRRMYVESTRAHNTVEIDGNDFPRVGVKPFGSFLKSGEEQGDLVVTVSEGLYTKTQRHRRILIFKPAEFLLVIDRLHDTAPHTYTQRFKFEPRWEARLENGEIRATTEGSLPVIARSFLPEAEALPVIRGQEQPRLLGWYSDKDRSLIPASSIGFEEKNAGEGRFVTLFTFGHELHIDPSAQKIDADLTAMSLKWVIDGQERGIKISAPTEGPVRAEMIGNGAEEREDQN